MVRVKYTKTVKLINKGSGNPITYPTSGAVTAGNLTNWVISTEVVNSTVSRTDRCTIVLRTDPAGTFIRAGPILIDESAKYKYFIQVQIHQGSTNGKLFRFEISDVELKEDQANGEVLVVRGRGLEYILKETMDSEQIYYKTPKQAFRQRIYNYQNTPTTGYTHFDSTGNAIPQWIEGISYSSGDKVVYNDVAYQANAAATLPTWLSGQWTNITGSTTKTDQSLTLTAPEGDIDLPNDQTIKHNKTQRHINIEQ